MAALVEFSAGEDTTVIVEVADGGQEGLVPVNDNNVAGRSTKSFEEAVSGLGPIAKSLFNSIQSVARRPTEVAVELGFKISGSGNLILVASQAEANFKATLKWLDTPRT